MYIISGLIELIITVGPYALSFGGACAVVFGLLSALQFNGKSLTKNEPFRWATVYPKFDQSED